MRPSKTSYFLSLADLSASRGTCCRRKVGCILVDINGHVLSTGYNGPPSGIPHCIDHPCAGASFPSGEGLEQCEAVHAEQNALLQCPNVNNIHIAYATTAPCVHCVKLLMNTTCAIIVFAEDYPHSEASKKLWMKLPHHEWRHEPTAL